jgi:hypothetical protein
MTACDLNTTTLPTIGYSDHKKHFRVDLFILICLIISLMILMIRKRLNRLDCEREQLKDYLRNRLRNCPINQQSLKLLTKKSC